MAGGEVMGTSRLIIAAIFALFLLAGNEAIADGVANAEGETPVRYVICGLGESNCTVFARFIDFESYETHRELSDLCCDWVSTPGTVIWKQCRSITKSYCTR
jgi:hypothetical protein